MMINFLKEFLTLSVPLSLMRSKTKVRLGDLRLNLDDKIYGDKKPFTVDSDNVVCDGHHRMNKLLKENGPDHEVEVLKYKYPQWTALLSMGTHSFFQWSALKWKTVKEGLQEHHRE